MLKAHDSRGNVGRVRGRGPRTTRTTWVDDITFNVNIDITCERTGVFHRGCMRAWPIFQNSRQARRAQRVLGLRCRSEADAEAPALIHVDRSARTMLL